MTLAVKEAVFAVWRRQRATTDVHASSSTAASTYDHDENEGSTSPFQAEAEAGEGSGLSDCVGIEHLLTRASMNEVRTCRARCVDAVLEEQARQMTDQSASSRLGWAAIALASLTQTRTSTLRAQILGQLHQESI